MNEIAFLHTKRKWHRKMPDLGFTNIFIYAFKQKLYAKTSINLMRS